MMVVVRKKAYKKFSDAALVQEYHRVYQEIGLMERLEKKASNLINNIGKEPPEQPRQEYEISLVLFEGNKREIKPYIEWDEVLGIIHELGHIEYIYAAERPIVGGTEYTLKTRADMLAELPEMEIDRRYLIGRLNKFLSATNIRKFSRLAYSDMHGKLKGLWGCVPMKN